VKPPLVIMDVGDVLIRTTPMAHYRQLARRLAWDWAAVATAVEESGIVERFETGQMSESVFVDAIRASLACPWLAHDEVEEAWQAVIGAADPSVAAVATDLARSGRLMLASNTNPFHWRVIGPRLERLGISCPVFLSFQIHSVKPAAEFFDCLLAAGVRPSSDVVFVDDRLDNVNAARHRGWTGWLHTDPKQTARRLAHLVH
jgi:HAD superfamily hydrolase (TIGR01509 family)